MTHHLVQINIARLIAPIDDPKIAEFVAQLEPINAHTGHGQIVDADLPTRRPASSGACNRNRATPPTSPTATIPSSSSTCRYGSRSRRCGISPTSRTTPASFATAPNGSRGWANRTTAFGGFRRATFPQSPRAASAFGTTSRMAPRRIPSGLHNPFRSLPTKASARSPEKKNGWQPPATLYRSGSDN